jgi:hypothetical protein
VAVLKPRLRIVSFRLSQEEYEALESTCIAAGARSISDFARSAACSLSLQGNGLLENAPETMIRALQKRVEDLDREVRRLTYLVELSQTHAMKRKGA